MNDPLTLFGWPVSPYSEKTRAWLRFKGLPVREITPSLWRMRMEVIPAVGQFVMPTVRRADGSWLQDSRIILDTLEAAHPDPASEPVGPRQRIASALFEVFGDEWLILAALHYRWNFDGNATFAIGEFARLGLPWMPGPISRRIAGRLAGRMRSYGPKFGVTPATRGGVERSTTAFIAALQVHLADHPYLLGARPCMGDFAVFGTLWAHLERDPHSRFLFDEAPDVLAWTARLREPSAAIGDYLPDDAIPETVDGLLRLVVGEQWPYLHAVLTAIDAWCTAHPGAERVPRALGDTPFRIGGCVGDRRLVTFQAWKAQRVLDRITAATDPEDPTDPIRAWLTTLGGDLLTDPPRVHRQRYVPHRLILSDADDG